MTDRVSTHLRAASRDRRKARLSLTLAALSVCLVLPLILSPWPGASLLAWVAAFALGALSVTYSEAARQHGRAATWERRRSFRSESQ